MPRRLIPILPPRGSFDRKVTWSRCALFLEDLWPRVWLVLGLIGLFLLASLAGVWQWVSRPAHVALLGVFAVALAAALVVVLRVRWPQREEAVRRLELRSGMPHRPATSYEDTLTLNGSDPNTAALWQAHKARLAQLIARLRVARPAPRTDRHDPIAMRALLLLGVVMLLGLVGDSARDRLTAAFRFGPATLPAEARLDAWITPPAYTARPPILLADGSRAMTPAAAEAKSLEVPDSSMLIARSSGTGSAELMLELKPEAGTPERKTGAPAAAGGDVLEARLKLDRSGVLRIMSGGTEVGRWTLHIVPDHAPKITLTKEPEINRRGGMKLTYKVEDDYGIASAEARFQKQVPDAGDARTAWAREEIVLKGPRRPRERPPVLSLRLPRSNAKEAETTSFHELGTHPWGGLKVRMTLVAKDHAGNIGRSQPVEMTFPQRQFFRPLARAVIEQRRKLNDDARWRPYAMRALESLTLAPDGFIRDHNVYLGLRSVYHRLARDKSRAGLKSVSEQLWHIAQRIEDGRGLTDIERRLRELQEQLSKALQDGASEEEIKRLMEELRQAMAEFMQQLARQLENMPMGEFQQGNQMLRPEDLDRMMSQLENMMRQGSRDSAQEMLSQLRDLLDQLQSGRFARMPGGQGQQMMQMLDQFGDLIGRQQRLMDDTYGQQRQQGQRGQRGQQGEQQGEGEGEGSGQGQLGRRQGELRDRLGRLQEGLRNFGMQGPSQLDGAGEAMENAERALRGGDYDTATREQGRALEQLRQGAQSMAEQMLQRMPSRFGQGPALDAPRDPLGRPQRSEGPDLGTSVKVPDEADIQRAREILEELRKRLGEPLRPSLELEYLERLLRQY